MEPDDQFPIEVVYALPDRQVLVALNVAPGTTAREALLLSGLAERFEIDPASAQLGIFGRLVTAGTVLGEGDRVEIYRPLIADAKEARRTRARSRR